MTPVHCRFRIGFAAVALALVAGVGGCSSDEDAARSGGSATERELEQLARTAREDDAPSQAAILEDGEITLAERRQSSQRVADCLVDGGFRLVNFETHDTLHGPDVWYYAEPPAGTALDNDSISNACERRFSSYVNDGWAIQHGGRLTERARVVLASCFEDAGLDLAPRVEGDLIDQLEGANASVVRSCIGRVQTSGPVALIG